MIKKLNLILLLLMTVGNVFSDNSEDHDIKNIQRRFYTQPDGIYFSISNFLPKKILNWNIVIEKNIDNRTNFESEENKLKIIPLGFYKKNDFEKYFLKKIDNTDDLNFIKTCYDHNSSLYYLKKDINFHDLIKNAEIVSKNNISFKTDFDPYNYWDKKLQKSNFLSEKMMYDLKLFGINQMENLQNKYTIIPTIELFHTSLYGTIDMSVFTVIRINFKVYKDNIEIYNKTFTQISNTNGDDDNWESSLAVWSFKDMYKIVTGVCIRKLLDSFYTDIEKVL
jgi:hypothetical protein